MAINYKKVLCSSLVGALLVCSNAYAGTVEVTNSTNTDLELTLEGDKGNIIPKADMKTILKSKETTTITVSKEDVKATSYVLSAKGMTNGKCTDLLVDGDYTATFSSEDQLVGAKCVSQKK